ncbi:site-specific integrase [Agarilytica rhodophyticola]|uniref:site-specific integrase n=1 Tax=Agarilytica rhodophyticola TaxID=1737490 RepID=UPI001319CF44|nr:site-specific integrase [Agarilytica rhodophyticola]
MIYDPMKDQSGQASKNSEYLGKLSKSNTFVESLGGGRFAIDRHAANTALSSTYAQTSDIEPAKAIKTAFAKNGTTIERGLQAINPSALKQKDFQPVVNALEKGLREGTKGLSKTQDGTYLMSGHVDSGERGPTLTPTKNWQFWSDLAQRDGLKAVMAGSPMRKEGDMSPSLSISPGSEKKQQPKLSEKVNALKEMQDDREKQRDKSREQSQKLAQEQRKKLEQRLAAEQARLNDTLKRHWNSDGVNNVHMQYRADKNQQPLKNELSPSTQKEYSKIARRLENIHPLQMPEYLQKRADQTSRQTWWKEHAVARRMLRSAEKQHFDNGEPEQGKTLAATRKNLQGIDYQSNRSQAPTQSHSKRKSQFSGEFYNQLLKDCNKRGDQELHDSLVVSRNSGLRPAELQKGIHMRVTNEATSEVAINIQGAKKSKGLEDAPSRYQNDHGQDRLLIVKSEELAELAKRHDGHFKPNSSEDALRMRLERTTDRLDPENEQNFSFYTLRHNSADEMREQGKSRSEIALHMGHTSEETQEGYGLNA